MAEPGFLTMTDAEVTAFRGYLLKGGFVIFDDFAERRGGWGQFRDARCGGCWPEGRFVDLDVLATRSSTPSIEIPNLNRFRSTTTPEADFPRDLREQRPDKRLLVMVNFNTDIRVLGVLDTGSETDRRDPTKRIS
jgi:hypothetical protein